MIQQEQVQSMERFEFGKNWQRFIHSMDAQSVTIAEKSLQEMLGLQTLAGLRFLDIGSGSGLFSLAARNLGAKVYSFDYDANSVWCTRELKRLHAPDDIDWEVAQGSVLDTAFLNGLGQFDVVL